MDDTGHASGWSVHRTSRGGYQYSVYSPLGGTIGWADDEVTATERALRALEALTGERAVSPDASSLGA